jgi:small nuclear ribonucleoprotein (snRNP)-like protein
MGKHIEVFNKAFIMRSQSHSIEDEQMSQNQPIKALEASVEDVVSVKLKDQRIFRGRLTRCDVYMNLTLADAEEIEDDQAKAKYGQILIRGNNILWIQVPD